MGCNPEVLKHVPLFALLDEDETAVLAGQVELKNFAPRQRIYKIGDPGGQAYVMVSGRVRVTTVDEDQQEVVVDVINLVSVESRLPVGLYDLGHVVGEIVFRAGRAGETYKGIGKYDLNLEGLPLFADTVGPHGSATSDSERTMVTSATKQVLAIIVSFSGTEGLERWAQRMAALLTQHAAGQSVEIQIIQ